MAGIKSVVLYGDGALNLYDSKLITFENLVVRYNFVDNDELFIILYYFGGILSNT